MSSTYCVILRDPIPDGLVDVLKGRFGDVRVARGRGHTHVECQLKDEAALRGMLTTIWDAGLCVLALLCVAVIVAEVDR